MPADDEKAYQHFLAHYRRAHEQIRREEAERWYQGQLKHEASEQVHKRFWLCVIGIPAGILTVVTLLWGS